MSVTGAVSGSARREGVPWSRERHHDFTLLAESHPCNWSRRWNGWQHQRSRRRRRLTNPHARHRVRVGKPNAPPARGTLRPRVTRNPHIAPPPPPPRQPAVGSASGDDSVQAEGWVAVGHEEKRIRLHAKRPSGNAHDEVKQASRLSPGNKDRKPGDSDRKNGQHHQCQQHDHVWDRQKQLHERKPAVEVTLDIRVVDLEMHGVV